MNLKRYLVLLCLLSTGSLCAQQAYIDSLERVLKTDIPDTQYIAIQLQLAKVHDLKDPLSSLKYAKLAFQKAEEIGNVPSFLEAAYDIGVIYQCDYFDSQEASAWFQKVISKCETTGFTHKLSDAYYNMGIVMNDLGDRKRAIQYLNRASKIGEQNNDFTMVCIANLELARQHEASPTECFSYLQRALRAAENQKDDLVTQAQVKFYMGNYYKNRKIKAEANIWYSRVVETCLKDSTLLADDIYLENLLAMSYYELNDLDAAQHWVNRILQVTRDSTGSLWYAIDAFQLQGNIYHKRGQDSMAYEILRHCYDLNDSLRTIRMSLSAQNRILGLETSFDVRQKEQQLELLTTRNRYQLWVVILLAALAIAFATFAFYLYKVRQREFVQNERLSNLVRTKDKILSIVSHDVRSPVNAMENILHLFDKNLVNVEDIQTVTTQVHASIQNLSQNLDNLFVWAQNQQQELAVHPEAIPLKKLIENQIALFEQRLTQKNITIYIDIEENVAAWIDPMHARLILQNILGNSLKFTHENGEICVTVEEKATWVYLKILDSGIGLEHGAQQKIFDPEIRYTRLGTNGEPGSGLGLLLTRDLLLLNGGQITLRQRSDQSGTQVLIQLAKA